MTSYVHHVDAREGELTDEGSPDLSPRLRAAVDVCRVAAMPMAIWAGAAERPPVANVALRKLLGNAWPNFRARLERGVASTFVSGASTTLERVATEDGATVRVTLSPLHDGDGASAVEGVIATLVDVTAEVAIERRQRLLRDLAEAALVSRSGVSAWEHCAATLARATDVSFAVLYRVDPVTRTATRVSTAGIAVDALPAEVALGSDRAPLGAVFATVFETGRMDQVSQPGVDDAVVVPLRRAGGALFGLVVLGRRTIDAGSREFFDTVGVQLSALLAARDDEAAAMARYGAEVERAKLFEILMQAPVAVAVIVAPDLRFEVANARFCEILGRTGIVGQTVHDAFPELRGRAAIAVLEDVFRTGAVRRVGGLDVPVRTGESPTSEERSYYSYVAQPIKDERGVVVAAMLVAVEVTEEVRVRRRLDELRAATEHAKRIKDEFLAMLGHELRNPLAPIVTALEVMKRRDPSAAPLERTIIDRQVKHLVRLVDDLLDVSRITRGKITLSRVDVDIADVIADAVEMASPILEKKSHVLRVFVTRERLFVNGDRARLVQVVSNLVTNAAKYTEARGHIDVTASLEDGMVVVRIRDDGVGIAPELLPRVFDLFEQGTRTIDRAGGGLGLGLAIVKNLVAVHGGSVAAKSELGKGSEFEVRLPAVLVPSSKSGISLGAKSPSVPKLSVRALRVLVVDDNADAADMLDVAVRAMGHATRVAYDGPEALAVAASFRPDVALVDIGLPVMDGYEVAEKLRQLFGAKLRLIAVTGYGQESDRARAHAAGFDRHLVKPIELSELGGLLEAMP